MLQYWNIVGPVAGGIIAALSGFVTYKLESKNREEKARREWNRRLVRLCERLNLEPGELDTEIQYAYRYTDVQPLLEDHLSAAPQDVDEEVFRIYEERIYPLKYIFQVGGKGTGHRPDSDDISELSDAVEKIISKVETERVDDSWYNRIV